MDFEQTFSFPLQSKLKNNKQFMQTKRLVRAGSNHSLNYKKDLYRKNDENVYSYGSLTEISEHVHDGTEHSQEELYDININENQNQTYSSSSLESIDINSDNNSEKSEKSNDSSDPRYEKLKTDEYGFIINNVFHKRTYKFVLIKKKK